MQALTKRPTHAIAVVVLIASLLFPVTVALALNRTIYPGKGIGGAKLGMNDKAASRYIGTVKKTVKDSRYDYVVYTRYFGAKKSGRYAVEMSSLGSNHKVFNFTINSSLYKTAKGIKVGSKEASLTAAYPGLSVSSGSVYKHYYTGSTKKTDYYVKKATSKVSIIMVRSR